MTLNLVNWISDAQTTIADAEEWSKQESWQDHTLDMMTDLVENGTISPGSKYQSLFGSLRHAYQEATGKTVYQEIKA